MQPRASVVCESAHKNRVLTESLRRSSAWRASGRKRGQAAEQTGGCQQGLAGRSAQRIRITLTGSGAGGCHCASHGSSRSATSGRLMK